ncbi:MAG: M50 family metallopeptidase [Thermoplasmata archaeon]|nr:M50 family metallopeptidase [Thermoplasmata archaeon]
MTLDGLALVFLWIAGLIVLSRLVDRLLVRTLPPYLYHAMILPGVAVHELSHAFACLLTGARVLEVKLFSKNGGYVKHTRSRLPVIGPVAISLAPLVGGVLVIYVIAYLMDYSGIGLLDPERPYSAVQTIWAFLSANALRWHFWAFLYLMISVAASLGPSDQDLKNSVIALIVLAVILAALIMASDLVASWLDVPARPLLSGLNIALFLLVISIVLVGPFYLLRRRLT